MESAASIEKDERQAGFRHREIHLEKNQAGLNLDQVFRQFSELLKLAGLSEFSFKPLDH
jgi:hypothetical protein